MLSPGTGPIGCCKAVPHHGWGSGKWISSPDDQPRSHWWRVMGGNGARQRYSSRAGEKPHFLVGCGLGGVHAIHCWRHILVCLAPQQLSRQKTRSYLPILRTRPAIWYLTARCGKGFPDNWSRPFPLHYFRPTNPTDAEDDGPACRCEAYAGDRQGVLPENRQRGRA